MIVVWLLHFFVRRLFSLLLSPEQHKKKKWKEIVKTIFYDAIFCMSQKRREIIKGWFQYNKIKGVKCNKLFTFFFVVNCK